MNDEYASMNDGTKFEPQASGENDVAYYAPASLEEADLYRADLRDINLEAANLRCANLRGASLRRANLHKAVLQMVQYDQYTEWPEEIDPEKLATQAI